MRARHRSSGSVIGLHDRSVHASGTTVLKEAVERSAPALIVLTLYSCVVHACSRLPGRTTTAPTRPRQLPRDPTERPSRACYTAVRRTRLLCPGDCVPPDPRQEKTRERQDTQHEQQYRCEDDNRAERADNDRHRPLRVCPVVVNDRVSGYRGQRLVRVHPNRYA